MAVDVLVLDAVDSAAALHRALEPLSCVVRSTVGTALGAARNGGCRLAIVEHLLEGRPVGFDALRGICDSSPNTRGVLLSASRDDEVESEARKRGFSFLRKPFGQWALEDLVRRLLGNATLCLKPLREDPPLLELGGLKFQLGPRTFAVAQLRGPLMWEGIEPAVIRAFLDSLTADGVRETIGLASGPAARAHLRRATGKARDFHGLDTLGPRALRLEILTNIMEPS